MGNKILDKVLDYAPIHNKINKLELRRNFEDLAGQIRPKCYFRNEPTPSFC